MVVSAPLDNLDSVGVRNQRRFRHVDSDHRSLERRPEWLDLAVARLCSNDIVRSRAQLITTVNTAPAGTATGSDRDPRRSREDFGCRLESPVSTVTEEFSKNRQLSLSHPVLDQKMICGVQTDNKNLTFPIHNASDRNKLKI